MELQIGNLSKQMRGETLNHYQSGLALDEYYKLVEYTESLENQVKKLNIDDVSKCSMFETDAIFTESNNCTNCGKTFKEH